jgi:hypothetical protein
MLTAKKDMKKQQLKNKVLLLFTLVLIITSCKNEYFDFAKKLEIEINQIESENGYKEIIIESDKLIINRNADPTTMRLKYDTIVDEIINEKDFIVVEYLNKKRSLQRVEANDFKFSKIIISGESYVKGDTMSIKWLGCDNVSDNFSCEIQIRKK